MSAVFISYAHLDNHPLSSGRDGWVSRFHHDLEVKLGELLGERVGIWRDAKLTGSDFFADTIVNQFLEVKALVSVLSPRYVKSEWCVREVEEFTRTAERTGGLRVKDKARLFKVVKTPIPPNEIPPPLVPLFNNLLGFEFFEVDPASGRPREFSEEFGPDAQRHYFERLYDVAYDLSNLLRALKAQAQGDKGPAPIPKSGKAVFLALASSDLQEQREQIRRELIEHGHDVQPDAPLPMVAEEFEEAVRNCLAQCDLAIHVVGSRYGIIPESADVSVVELQNLLAAAHMGKPGFARLIWLPRDLQPQNERQADFIRRLQENEAELRGAELVRDPLEKFKELMLGKLAPPPPAPSPTPVPAAPGAALPARVYLIGDQQDDPALDPIEDFLFDQGFDVSRSQFDGDEGSIAQAHRQALQLCDGALIYYGAGSRAWVEVKVMDLLQAPGHGRDKPIRAQAVCIAPPDTRDKQRFRSRSADVIRFPAGFSAEALGPFLEALRQPG